MSKKVPEVLPETMPDQAPDLRYDRDTAADIASFSDSVARYLCSLCETQSEAETDIITRRVYQYFSEKYQPGDYPHVVIMQFLLSEFRSPAFAQLFFESDYRLLEAETELINAAAIYQPLRRHVPRSAYNLNPFTRWRDDHLASTVRTLRRQHALTLFRHDPAAQAVIQALDSHCFDDLRYRRWQDLLIDSEELHDYPEIRKVLVQDPLGIIEYDCVEAIGYAH